MTTDKVKPPLKTLRYRVMDKTSGKKLDAAARAVNFRVEPLQRRPMPRTQAQSALAE